MGNEYGLRTERQDSLQAKLDELRARLMERQRRARAMQALIASLEHQICSLTQSPDDVLPRFHAEFALDDIPPVDDTPPPRRGHSAKPDAEALVKYSAALAKADAVLTDLERALAERLARLEMLRAKVGRAS